jgi:PTS system ascorbate-specific IIC component
MDLLMIVIKDVLGNAAILVGLVALVGLIVQGKPPAQVFTGTIKTIVGFLIFYIGAGAGVAALNNFQTLFVEGFQLQGVLPLAEALTALALTKLGTETALIMVLGFAVNLVVARFTPLKYIFLTGQHNLFFAALLAVVFSAAGLETPLVVLLGALVLGFFAAFFPWIGRSGMRAITGGNEIGIGHYVTIGYALSAWIGRRVGSPDDSTEKIKLPEWLGFFRDYVASISLTMLVVYYVAALAAGQTAVDKVAGGVNWLVFPLVQALTFAGAVYVIITGVRMFLGEIVPAFVGISSRVIPNAIPALDCPVVFPYAPTAVIIGFISAYIAGLASMGILILAGATVIIPVAIPYFFIGATAGVFGNATGGWKGAIAGSFVVGILIAVGPAIIYPIMAQVGLSGTSFPETDFTSTGAILYALFSNLDWPIATVIVVAILAALLWIASWVTAAERRRAELASAQESA